MPSQVEAMIELDTRHASDVGKLMVVWAAACNVERDVSGIGAGSF